MPVWFKLVTGNNDGRTDLSSANSKELYSVHYKFNGDFSPINKWLSKNCGGTFDYSIEDKPETHGSMVDVELRFEKEEDRANFKNMILAGLATQSGA